VSGAPVSGPPVSGPFIAVELDSPAANGGQRENPGAFGRYLEAATRLRDAGARAITVADNPLASPRADSCMLAAAVVRETGIPVIPHLACRDRNRNALLSALLALDLLGNREILAVTGDPVRPEDRAAVKSAASFDSVGFARLVAEWNETLFERPFAVSGALNVNAPNFPAELARAERKREAGVRRFFTQPIFSERALRNLERAREALDAELLAGILPVLSAKNARYLAENVRGIALDPGLERRLEGTDREGAAAIASETAAETAKAALRVVTGLYLITPFRRIDIVERILRGLGLQPEASPVYFPHEAPEPRPSAFPVGIQLRPVHCGGLR